MNSSEIRDLERIRRVLLFAFFAMLALMALIIATGVFQVRAVADDIEQVVDRYNRKQNVVTDMQIAGYHRSDSIYNMLVASDPFDRDDYYQAFNKAGFDVGTQRQALLEQGLSAQERQHMDELDRAIAQVLSYQNRITDLLNQGEDAQARALIQTPTLGLHQRINDEFAALRQIQIDAADRTLANADQASTRTLAIGLTLGGFSLMLGVFITAYTSIRFRRQSDSMRHFVEQLDHARQHADHANQAKSQFLATMSHEIRTPMNGVLGMAQLMRKTGLNSEQTDYLETITSSGETLLTLLNDVLDISKIESGRLELENTELDLKRLCEGVLLLMSGKAAEKGIKLDLHVDARIPLAVKGDPTRLRQVLFNLVGNAVKFTEKGSVEIHLRKIGAEQNSQRIHIAVIDTGIGIEQEAVPKLLQAFTQADSSITRRFGGSGLGLNICNRLIEAMGGKLQIESTPGQGSSFEFDLNMAVGDASKLPTLIDPVVAQQRPPELLGRHILIAEDDPVNQKVAQGMLSDLGCSSDIAEDGQQALERVHQKAYDLILMDMQMPNMGGLEAARRIRALSDPERAQVPIVALTASIDPSIVNDCEKAGINQHLSKPVSELQLLETLRHCLSNKPGATATPSQTTPANPSPTTSPTTESTSTPSAPAKLNQATLNKLIKTMGVDGVQELTALYADSSARLLVELSQCWEQGDRDALRIKAHRFKGSSLSVGLEHPASIARDLELKSEESDLEALREIISALSPARELAINTLSQWLAAR